MDFEFSGKIVKFFQNNPRTKKVRETFYTPLNLSRQDASNGIKHVVLS